MNKNLRLYFITLAILSQGCDANCYQISADLSSPAVERLTPYFVKIFADAGYCANIVHLQLAEGDKALMEGSIDGVVPRVAEFSAVGGKSIIRVPTPILVMNGHFITLKDRTQPVTLDRQNWTIGYRRGTFWQDPVVATFTHRLEFTSPLKLAEALLDDSVNIAIFADGTINGLLSSGVLDKNKIEISEPVATTSIHFYLAAKNHSIVNAVDISLKNNPFPNKLLMSK